MSTEPQKKSDLIPKMNNSLIELFAACPLIQQKDIENLESAKNFIVETYASVPMYRPLAVKIIGVLSNKEHPTNESKLWQCKVEAEVHANELVRDLHDLEKIKIQIERNDYLLNRVMVDKLANAQDDHMKAEIGFDMRQLAVTVSQQKFELFQLQKRIKYRIEEVHEWKILNDKLLGAGTKNIPYSEMLIQNYEKKWTEELNNPEITPEDKINLQTKLAMVKKPQ
jgi:hypothetical protein